MTSRQQINVNKTVSKASAYKTRVFIKFFLKVILFNGPWQPDELPRENYQPSEEQRHEGLVEKVRGIYCEHRKKK